MDSVRRWICCWFVAFCCLFFIQAAAAQDTTAQYLSYDSIDNYPTYLSNSWLYAPGDDTLRAAKEFNDSKWIAASIQLNQGDSDKTEFPGIGWFRVHLHIDSTLK